MNIIEWFQKHDTLNLTVARVEFVSGVPAPGGRGEGVVPNYMVYTGMCRWTGYGFCPLYPKNRV